MKHYTSYVPYDLAEKLQNAGMPCRLDLSIERSDITYASCIDWFLEQGLMISISRYYDFAKERIDDSWEWSIERTGSLHNPVPYGYADKWHEAADTAIRTALKIINPEDK